PGDVLGLTHAGRTRLLRITEVGDHGAREVDALGVDPDIYRAGAVVARPAKPVGDPTGGPLLRVFLGLPLLPGTEAPEAGYAAAARSPWPAGGAAFYRSPVDAGFTLAATAGQCAVMGVTLEVLPPGPESRLDHASRLGVKLHAGALTSTT